MQLLALLALKVISLAVSNMIYGLITLLTDLCNLEVVEIYCSFLTFQGGAEVFIAKYTKLA